MDFMSSIDKLGFPLFPDVSTVAISSNFSVQPKTMKFLLFLGFVALAQGMTLKEGSTMEVSFKGGPESGCIFGCDGGDTRYTCEGSATVISIDDNAEDRDVHEHGTLLKREKDRDDQWIDKINYKGRMKRKFEKIIQTQGNCCWAFFKRYNQIK